MPSLAPPILVDLSIGKDPACHAEPSTQEPSKAALTALNGTPHSFGKGLRASPAPVQEVLKRGSTRVLHALGATPDRNPAQERRLVWQTPDVPLPDGLSMAEAEKVFRSWSVNGEPVGHMDGYVTDSKLRFLYTWGLVRHDTSKCSGARRQPLLHDLAARRHELHRLLEFAGFDIETSMTADGHPSDATKWEMYDAAAPLIESRQPNLGHYLYVRARATRQPREGLPSFLYRSWPVGKIVGFE